MHCSFPPNPAPAQQQENVTCTIEVGARPVHLGGSNNSTSSSNGVATSGYHSYILTRQSNQNSSTIFQGLHVTNNLTARRGDYGPSAGLDYQTGDHIYESTVRGGSCSRWNKSFGETVNLTNSSNVPYAVGSTNSNAFVFTSLQRAGLDTNYFYDSLRSQIRNDTYVLPTFFPGWGTTLPLGRR